MASALGPLLCVLPFRTVCLFHVFLDRFTRFFATVRYSAHHSYWNPSHSKKGTFFHARYIILLHLLFCLPVPVKAPFHQVAGGNASSFLIRHSEDDNSQMYHSILQIKCIVFSHKSFQEITNSYIPSVHYNYPY